MVKTTVPADAFEPSHGELTTARSRQASRKKLRAQPSMQHVDLAAYADWSRQQIKRSVADQTTVILSRFREATAHGRRAESRVAAGLLEDSKASNWSYPRHSVFFSGGAPYTAGTPNPEIAMRTPGTAKGAYYNIESFADADRGRISLGISAGVWRNVAWTGGTYYSELPEQWLLGDAISASASILQVIDLPQDLQPGVNINAAVQFSWLPMYRHSAAQYDGYVYNAVETVPGLHSAALNGLVAVTVLASTRVSLFSGPDMAGTATNSMYILQLGVDADSYGKVDDKVDAPYLFLDFAFAGNPWALQEIVTSIPAVDGATHMIVDTTFYLIGLRGGQNDPDAGSVSAAFMDLYDPASPVADIPDAPNPFTVNRITAFTTTV